MNTANYSSACGAMDVSSYKRKNRPCAMLIGAVHGNEPEGIAAILNLISMIETGKSLTVRQITPLKILPIKWICF